MARAENLAVMFVDMAGFAERTARQSREQNKVLMRDFNGLLVPLLARFGGHRVKSIGDALLVTFRSPTDSVRCAMAMHDAVASYNQRTPGEPIQIRVALNAGEVRVEPDDVFGEAVNIAARVEEVTPPGEIYLTGVMYLSMNKAEVPAEHIGERMLKGVPEPTRLFRVPAHKLSRLTPAGEAIAAMPGELPYGGMHMLPPDTHVLTRVVDTFRRAPYIDWGAKARSISARAVLTTVAAIGVGAALISVAYALLAVKPPVATAPGPVAQGPPVVMNVLPPAPVAVNAKARETLAKAHNLYFANKRVEAAKMYAKVLEMDAGLQRDSGLAANLVGTLGHSPAAMATIRKFASPEIQYELGRRTSQPGRKGAERAAQLLKEQGQSGRIDRGAMALNNFSEAETCEDRLEAVKVLRALREVRALPVLEQTLHTGFRGIFQQDQHRCFRREAEATIDELKRLSPPPTS
jgi:class 3 adenylate cyclase